MQKTYAVKLTGTMPLLMHADSVEWADKMEAWQKIPENKKNSKAGDDRTPAWRWLGYVYHDDKHLCLPSDNLMTALREGGAKVPTGKGQSTFKKQSQTGIIVDQTGWPIEGTKGLISWADIRQLMEEDDFSAHQSRASALGFDLFVKRAKVGQSKHVRVRPRFNHWTASGTVTVLDETITRNVFEHILVNAGRYCGIGDWRPSSPKSPGPWGQFRAEITEV